jgi:hypothetical protein
MSSITEGFDGVAAPSVPAERNWRAYITHGARLLWLGRYGLWAAAIIAFAAALRLTLMLLGWLPINSDEATMGLMASHIAFRGEWPIWYYGQFYMGAFEAYLAAPFFRLFGPSVVTLRLGLLLLFALFLVCMYFLIALLFSRRVALASIALLSFGSVEVLFHEMTADGGYAETLMFGALLLLLAVWLGISSTYTPTITRRVWRVLAYAGWGLAAGLALWSDLLVAPFVLTSCLFLLVFRGRELVIRMGWLVLLCAAIGAFPLISYNLHAAPGQDSWHVLQQIETSGAGQTDVHITRTQRIEGTLLISLPNAIGATPLCPIAPEDAWPLPAHPSPRVIQCSLVRGAWGLGFLVLGIIAAWLALTGIGRLCWRVVTRLYWRTTPITWSMEEQRMAMVHAGRLAVLGAAALTLALYARSTAPALTPWPSARYLFTLLIALPVALGPLWEAASSPAHTYTWHRLLARAPAYAALMLFGLVFVAGTYNVFNSVGGSQNENRSQDAVVTTLLQNDATRIYGDYWTCAWVTFESQERIICSVLNDDLSPGMDRYLPYRAIVQAAKHPAYVFPLASPQAAAFARQIAQSRARYQRLVLDGYVIYTPVSPSSAERPRASAVR